MLDEGWPAWSDHDRRVVQFGTAIIHLFVMLLIWPTLVSSFDYLFVGSNLDLGFKVVIPASTDLSTNTARALIRCSGSSDRNRTARAAYTPKGSYSVDNNIPYTTTDV